MNAQQVFLLFILQSTLYNSQLKFCPSNKSKIMLSCNSTLITLAVDCGQGPNTCYCFSFLFYNKMQLLIYLTLIG